ncbi:MAG: PorV/PorQ family protein [Candidatus Delongbacteria bacterium]|nr:PorV/PorQ family protein [Candidatus Delongbacteria bacterium]
MKSLLFLMVFLLPAVVFSQAKTGTAAMTFLKIDVSARANALGGSFIGLANDVSTLHYNPAGMINIQQPDFGVSHTMYLADIQYTWGGLVFPLKEMNAAVGFQSSFLIVGDMDETTIDKPQGTGRTFSAHDMMVGASYAQMLTPKFYIGGTLKFLQEKLANESAWSVAGDVGTYYDTKWKSLIFGMSIRNFGTAVEFINESADLPMMFVFGIGFNPYDDGINKLSTLVEAGHPSDNNEYITVGLEYSFDDMFFLRAGRKIDELENWLGDEDKYVKFKDNADGTSVNYDPESFNNFGTSIGVGFKLSQFRFDYSWESYGRLGGINMFNVSLSF